MAAELVTLDHAKSSLKLPLDYHAQDDDLQMKLEQAHEIVLDFLKQRISGASTWVVTVDAWTDETVPKTVQAAILYQFGELYRFGRGDDGSDKMPEREPGCLAPYVEALLAKYRDPALA